MTATTATKTQRIPRQAWLVIAAKEFTDHLLSARFVVLVLVLGLAAMVPLYFAADRIRESASAASGAPAIFLALFTVGPEDLPIPPVTSLVAILAPLLGISFAFDAINGERSDGTLPRLLSQPVHRDDVINGKFAAGLGIIALVLTAIVLLIAGVGIFRLGIVPRSTEVIRIVLWLLMTVLYVGFWLAFGLLLSVVVRRAATSALIGFGVWALISVFGPLLVGLIAGLIAPTSGARTEDQLLSALQLQQQITRLIPTTMYSVVSLVLLAPTVRAEDIQTPGSLAELIQSRSQVQDLTPFSLDQSLLLVWPQIVALVAIMVVCFVLAYIAFMRQEVRA